MWPNVQQGSRLGGSLGYSTRFLLLPPHLPTCHSRIIYDSNYYLTVKKDKPGN